MLLFAGDYVGPRLAPAAFGFVTLFFALGQVLGPAFGGYITDLTGTFRPSLVSAAAVALCGSFGSLLLKKPAQSKIEII
ncbi:MAG: YbfB/YjiJ family MFS transporter [Bacillota bacterium]|nr:YbfB/YjiJ family MFS transporter [Bacillota bacterium]